MSDEYLPLNCPPLDQLLGGGVERGIITEIYGAGGTGKTNLCIQAARAAASRGDKVVFVDTEGVSQTRMSQVFGESKKLMEKLLLFNPYSIEEQETMVEKALKINAGLILIDSINLYYRLGIESEEGAATRSLTRQLVSLQVIARKKNIPVLITAQVYSTGEEVKPFGGRCIDHMAKTVVRLEKIENGEKKEKKESRQATLVKHRAQPGGKTTRFYITASGLE
ncbi:MAG: DNA repair and recombination protein RadB [Thermoplasmatota archaeon]